MGAARFFSVWHKVSFMSETFSSLRSYQLPYSCPMSQPYCIAQITGTWGCGPHTFFLSQTQLSTSFLFHCYFFNNLWLCIAHCPLNFSPQIFTWSLDTSEISPKWHNFSLTQLWFSMCIKFHVARSILKGFSLLHLRTTMSGSIKNPLRFSFT